MNLGQRLNIIDQDFKNYKKNNKNNKLDKFAISKLITMIRWIYIILNQNDKIFSEWIKEKDIDIIKAGLVKSNTYCLEAKTYPLPKSNFFIYYWITFFKNGEWIFEAQDSFKKNKLKIKSQLPTDLQWSYSDNFSNKVYYLLNDKGLLGKSTMKKITQKNLMGNAFTFGISFGKPQDINRIVAQPVAKGANIYYDTLTGTIYGADFDETKGWNKKKAADWINNNRGKNFKDNPYVKQNEVKRNWKASDLDEAQGGNCYHARLRNPDMFDLRRTVDFGKKEDSKDKDGIKAVWARFKKEKGKWAWQSFMFDKNIWTKANAANWLNKHKNL